MAHLPGPKSEQKDFTPGGNAEFDNWMNIRGPRNGRNVIKGFWICLFGTVTNTVAALDGRSVPRFISHLAVETRSGSRRWSLTGEKSRAASIRYNGIDRHNEHANIAVGAAQAVDLMLYVPMEKRFIKRGVDLAMGVDTFTKVVITWSTLAGVTDTGGAVLTAHDLDCYLIADLREENAVEVKAEDSVKSVNFTSQTETVVKLTGALHDADIYRETSPSTPGGAAITAITDVRCDDLGIPVHKRTDLVRMFKAKRQLGNTAKNATIGTERFNDPVVDGQMLPIIVADNETSLWGGKIVEQAKFNLGAGVADLSLITREVLAKNQENFAATAATFGLDPKNFRMKTAGKSKRDLKSHSKRAKQVGVWSHPLHDYIDE